MPALLMDYGNKVKKQKRRKRFHSYSSHNLIHSSTNNYSLLEGADPEKDIAGKGSPAAASASAFTDPPTIEN